MLDHHKVSIIVGVGALGVLIYLLLQKSASTGSNGSSVSDESVAQPPVYPQNPTPQPANIDIGASPINMTYNYGDPLPTLTIGDNTGGTCGCDSECETAGQKVTVQNVPADILASASDNLASFQAKIPPRRITLTQSAQPDGGSLVQPSSVGGRKLAG